MASEGKPVPVAASKAEVSTCMYIPHTRYVAVDVEAL